MQKKISTINGNSFLYEVVPKEEVNILDVGYIITPTGEFIKIEGDHNVDFSNYINAYLENKVMQYYDLFEAIKILTSLGHIVYGGLRKEDIKSIQCGRNISSLCTIFLPNGDVDVELTDDQKESLRILLDTNRSMMNPKYKKVDLNIFRMSSSTPLLDEEIEKLLKVSFDAERRKK